MTWVYLNLTRFCFSVPYALCIEKINVKKSKQKTKYIIKITFEGWAFNFIKKETLAQVFSCEFCKISKNTFFNRTPLVAAYYDASLFIFVPMINPLVQATPYQIETK